MPYTQLKSNRWFPYLFCGILSFSYFSIVCRYKGNLIYKTISRNVYSLVEEWRQNKFFIVVIIIIQYICIIFPYLVWNNYANLSWQAARHPTIPQSMLGSLVLVTSLITWYIQIVGHGIVLQSTIIMISTQLKLVHLYGG